jgi:alpha,alpha-trehalose phosphorylase
VPYDEALGVHQQADGFTRHAEWNFETTGPDHYPLLLHFPYFDLYRRQVVKQPDLVLALHLCGDAFTQEEKTRNFDYYERRTVRDSSLAACTHAVVAAEVGLTELAYDYLGEAALVDLHDLHENSRAGLHIASLAGTWIAVVAGLGGMRDHGGRLSFSPRLPQDLTRLAFRMCFRGRRVGVEVTHEQVEYRITSGSPLELDHYGERFEVSSSEPVTRTIPDPPARDRPPQPKGREPRAREGLAAESQQQQRDVTSA